MTNASVSHWEANRTEETRQVEAVLQNAGFEKVDAYRYNSASIRVRVIDPRFEGLPPEQRDAMVEPYLEKLPQRTQADIMNLFTFAPSELEQTPKTSGVFRLNSEFDDPSPSIL
jgi:DNA-directed RNA polymerase specialized sigma24 family protein